MYKLLCMLLALIVCQPVWSCASHYYAPGLDVKGSHLVSLRFPSFVTAKVNQEQEFVLFYDQTADNDTVVLELSGSRNITFTKNKIPLAGLTGNQTIRFTLQEFGFGLIQMKISGQHKGKQFIETSKFFVRSQKK